MLVRPLSWLSLALSLVALVLETAVVDADADFESVRVRLMKSYSGKAGDPKEKYFRELLPAMEPVPPPQWSPANLTSLDESV